MKIVLILVLAIAVFAGTLVGALAFTGNLSKEGMRRLTGQSRPPAAAPAPVDDLDAVALEFRRREEKLRELEAKAQADADRARLAERDLDELRTEMRNLLDEMKTSLDEADTQREARLQEVADLLSGMDPQRAVQILSDYAPEEVIEIMKKFKRDRERTELLDAMEPSRAAAILRALKQVPGGA